MTLTELEQLGTLFRRGGPRWHRYLEPLRELWRATRSGGLAQWSHEHAQLLARSLGLGTHPLPFGTHCPTCPRPDNKTYASTRTMLSLPDRYVAECTRCGSEWVRLTEKKHLEPFQTRSLTM